MLRHRTDRRKRLNQLFSVQTRRIDPRGRVRAYPWELPAAGNGYTTVYNSLVDLIRTATCTSKHTDVRQSNRSVTKRKCLMIIPHFFYLLMKQTKLFVNGPFVEKFPSAVLLYCPFLRRRPMRRAISIQKCVENGEDMYIPLRRVHFLQLSD